MRAVLMCCVVLLLPLAGTAAETPKPAPRPSAEAPPPPPLPKNETRSAPSTETDPGLEPQITITTRGNTRYEEYRLHGRHYMTKVIPKNGKPYYLVDREGNGQFRRSDLEPTITVPQWVIKSW